MSESTAAALLAEVDRTRRRLYVLLRAQDPRALSKRPPSGAWSALENVRHLVFAEQKHLGDFLPDGSAWNPMKMRATSRKMFTTQGGDVVFRYQERQLLAEYTGTQPKNDLEAVLQSWDLIHKPIRNALKAPRGEPQRALQGNLQHLLAHVEAIESLLPRVASRR